MKRKIMSTFLILICIISFFSLVGCSKKTYITNDDTKSLRKSIMRNYDIVKDIEYYAMNNDFYIHVITKDPMPKEDSDKLVELFKDLLSKEDLQSLVYEKSGQNLLECNIAITFLTTDNDITHAYSAERGIKSNWNYHGVNK